MVERKQGRIHDAAGAREAILNAATELFAAHGFSGAHIQGIAEAAGYTKSMIFHYFGDKIGLYRGVVERMMTLILPEEDVQLMQALLMDKATPRDVHKLTTLITTVIRGNFDILRANPKSRRLFLWEAAEEWQTTKLLLEKLPASDDNRFEQIIREAQVAGLVRPDIDFAVLFTFVQDSGLFYLSMLPRLQILLNNEQMSTEEELARACEQITRLIIHGVMVNPLEA